MCIYCYTTDDFKQSSKVTETPSYVAINGSEKVLLGVADTNGKIFVSSDEIDDVFDQHVVSVLSFDNYVKKVTSTIDEIFECAHRDDTRLITQTVASARSSLLNEEKDTMKKKKKVKYELPYTDWLHTLISCKLQPLYCLFHHLLQPMSMFSQRVT